MTRSFARPANKSELCRESCENAKWGRADLAKEWQRRRVGGCWNPKRAARGLVAKMPEKICACMVVAASAQPHLAAVVGCNARTDLVDRVLGRISVPTLLIAGTRATEVLAANRVAIQELRCEKRMVIAAGNLKVSLEGRGARKVGNLAARWLDRHVARRNSAGGMR